MGKLGLLIFSTYHLLTIHSSLAKSATAEVTTCDAAATFYGWCEQSICRQGCRCRHNKKICKQICSQKSCSTLKCVSSKSCRQSVLLASQNQRPVIRSMIASSVEIQQDCSHAECRLLSAKRYQNKRSTALQICPEGKCTKMLSNADISEQLAGITYVMRCSGAHARNCTQVCVLGRCRTMVCRARYCVQRCIQNSECDMTCGRHTKHCEQICSTGSKCNMKCNAKNCDQKCHSDTDKENCVIVGGGDKGEKKKKKKEGFRIHKVTDVGYNKTAVVVGVKKVAVVGPSPSQNDVENNSVGLSHANHIFDGVSKVLLTMIVLHVVFFNTR